MSNVRCRAIGTWLAAVLALAAPSALAARAGDDWQTAEFTSPAGKPARGIARDASGEPRARLLIGCESEGEGWRGVAVWRAVKEEPQKASAEVVVSFFGRAPVTERWQQRADGADGALLWPASGEGLRDKLRREDATRGRATVTIEVREEGRPPVRLVFPVAGLADHEADVAAACGGWGGTTTAHPGYRERRW